MKKKVVYFLRILLVSFGSCTVFAGFSYFLQKRCLEEQIDKQLHDYTTVALQILPANYHDVIVNKSSVSNKDYIAIVDKYNQLCKKVGLEYLWTLMLTEDNKIVFTSGTATSKSIGVGDFARFFEPHSNPELYEDCFASMEPEVRVNVDKWGRIKAVLIPYRDVKGRPFLVGASMKMDDLEEQIRAIGRTLLIILAAFLIVLIPLSYYLTCKLEGNDKKAE